MKKIIILVLMLPFAVMYLSADGAGGLFNGYQVSSYPFAEGLEFENNNMDLNIQGGFGYGISRNNTISGGFGYVIYNPEEDERPLGGFGGVINGMRFLSYPVNISVLAWTGLGGICLDDSDKQIFALSEEITLEVGFPLFRWFAPSVYAGYQFIGSLGPGRLFDDFLSYTPVVGFRFQWGKFY